LPGVIISALGCYVPPAILSNHDLEKMVETSDEWILQRVGISERHIASRGWLPFGLSVLGVARRSEAAA